METLIAKFQVIEKHSIKNDPYSSEIKKKKGGGATNIRRLI